MDIAREHDMKCMSSFFSQPDHKKATYRYIWTTGLQGPWNTDRHSELDLFLVFRRWSNSVIDVEADKNANIGTNHLALVIRVKQKLKAIKRDGTEVTQKGARAETHTRGGLQWSYTEGNT